MMKLRLYYALVLTLASVKSTEIEEESCSKSISQMMTKLNEESNKREKFETNLNAFAFEHNLESGHKALKKVLKGKSKIMKIEDDMPLEMYLVQYQRKLQEEAETRLIRHLNDEFYDAELAIFKKFDKELSSSESTIQKKLDSIISKIDIEINDNLRNEIYYHIKNFTEEFYGFKKTITDLEILSRRSQKNEIEKLQDKVDLQITANEECNKDLKVLADKIKFDLITPFDCFDILTSGKNESGLYTIYPRGIPYKVYCDMETDGGGWTVFILRKKQPVQLDFKKKWEDYKNGFGSPPNEYWLGLEALNQMTTSKHYSMRADAVGDGNPNINWGEWSNFKVESECMKYLLRITGFNVNSTMRDDTSFGYNDQMQFTTTDQDNDQWDDGNCAEATAKDYQGRGGGFWFKASRCSSQVPTHPYDNFIFYYWSNIDNGERRVSSLEMKIRPRMW